MHSGLILHPTYRVRSGRPVVQLYGRLSGGRPFLLEDDRFRPYFFVRETDVDVARRGRGVEVRATELHTLSGDPVVRATLPTPGDVPAQRHQLAAQGIPSFEADIRFAYRYMMDLALHTSVAIDGRVTSERGNLLYFHNPELTSGECDAEFTHLSIDLETSSDASEIFSVALVGRQTEEVHLVSRDRVPGARSHPNERALLIAVAARIRELDPDLLVGWNVIDFDLAVFALRCRQLAIPQQASSIGRAPGPIEFLSDASFARQSRASIPGRMVLDAIPLVRDALRLDDYRLQTVSQAVLGRGKLIDDETPDPASEITRLYHEQPDALVAYNLEDARLVSEILEQEGLLTLAGERSRLSGMQLDRVGASIASFDLLYLPELRRRGYVAPNVDTSRSQQLVQGGAVLSPEPGLIDNVAVFDFKSLYPSLIRTFNIDPLALACGEREPPGSAIVAPNGARLSREPAILPRIIERFMAGRERARRRGDRHAEQAIKIMMNSMFGVFAARACRFFDPNLANAITSFGQQTLTWACQAFERDGVRILYGDTDSVFVQLTGAAEAESACVEANGLRERVTDELGARIAHEYDVEAKLDLELEKIFAHLYLPRVRRGRAGSKKRYAGWLAGEERLEIVGLESVRRDWPAVARRLQRGMLTRLFHNEDTRPFVREVVGRVRSGELDHELVYTRRIRKRSLEHYTASSPPHVQAARELQSRLGKEPGSTVRYVITQRGPRALLPGEPLPPDIDRRHYVERVLRPVAEAILSELESSFDAALGEPYQLNLLQPSSLP